MSRTDKTAPWNVKALYYPTWVVERHDHTDGVCNLPPRPTVENVDSWGLRRSDCYWSYSLEFMRAPLQRCGCPMCGYDSYWETPRRKKDRMAARRYCRSGWQSEY